MTVAGEYEGLPTAMQRVVDTLCDRAFVKDALAQDCVGEWEISARPSAEKGKVDWVGSCRQKNALPLIFAGCRQIGEAKP